MKTSGQKKHEKELIAAKHLMSLLKYDYEACINGQDPPDIELIIEGKKIGLEITDLLNEKLFQKDGSLQRLIQELELEYIKKFPTNNLHINIAFNDFEIRKIERGNIIEQIINDINWDLKNYKTYRKYYRRIAIFARNTKQFRILPSLDAGYMLSVTDESVDKTVRKKEADLPRYRSTYYECWLLITLPDSLNPSSNYFLPELTEQPLCKIKSEFDRVFIMRNYRVECLK